MFQREFVEQIKFNNFFQKTVLYQIMWKNIVEPGRPKMTILRLLKARWIPRATNTLSEYVIIFAFQPQQQLQKRVPLLGYTYIG
jgi:hypothetical protein